MRGEGTRAGTALSAFMESNGRLICRETERSPGAVLQKLAEMNLTLAWILRLERRVSRLSFSMQSQISFRYS